MRITLFLEFSFIREDILIKGIAILNKTISSYRQYNYVNSKKKKNNVSVTFCNYYGVTKNYNELNYLLNVNGCHLSHSKV